MAAAAPITGAPSRASGFLEPFSATRRGALGAMIAGAALAAPATSAAVATSASTEWDRLLTRMSVAKAQAERYAETRVRRALDALERMAPSPPEYIEVKARSGSVARHPFPCWDLDRYENHPVPQIRNAALDAKRLYQARRDAEKSIGFDSIMERAEELQFAWEKLADQLIAMPAPHLPALLWKLEYLFGANKRMSDGDTLPYPSELMDPIMQDAQRLLVA